jgi:hypothetical protein
MQSDEKNRSGLRRRVQRGAEMIEFTLVLLPFLGFTALILNIAYSVYQRATIQHAVSQGVRYAVTSQVMTGLGARASVQTYVQQNAFGVLNRNPGSAALGTNGWNGIYVDWYLVDPNTGSYTSGDGPPPTPPAIGGNCMQADGNLPLVSVSVQSLPGKLFVPFVHSPGMGALSAITTGAYAWDRMEAPAESNGGYVCPAQ